MFGMSTPEGSDAGGPENKACNKLNFIFVVQLGLLKKSSPPSWERDVSRTMLTFQRFHRFLLNGET